MGANMSDSSVPPCLILFSNEEENEALRLEAAQMEADEQLQACRDIIGIGTEGWVPVEQYEATKGRERKFKADTMETADIEEERRALEENWMFDDVDEENS